jgi:hypothetical protein
MDTQGEAAMSERQSATSDSEQVSRAAELYTHINELLDPLGELKGVIHYHLGFLHATASLADKLEGVGVDASSRLLDVCCGWGVPTRYVAGRFGCKITGVDITQRSIDFATKSTEGTDLEPLLTFRQGSALSLPSATSRTGPACWPSASACFARAATSSLRTGCAGSSSLPMSIAPSATRGRFTSWRLPKATPRC